MKELGITKGEWKVDFNRVPNGMPDLNEQISIRTDEWDIACAFVDITDEGEEEKANALLIADAGNTAQSCGLLPSELLRQRDTIYVLAMEFISEVIKGTGADRAGNYAIKIEAAIKSTEQ